MVLTEEQAYALEHEVSVCVAHIRYAMEFTRNHPTSGGFYAFGPTMLDDLLKIANRLERVAGEIHGGA